MADPTYVDKTTQQVYGDLWYLRFREKNEVREVVIRAPNYQRAVTVGERYSGAKGGRFVRVTPMIVADETILKGDVKVEVGL